MLCWQSYCNIEMYEISKLYTLNLHKLCQLYLNKKIIELPLTDRSKIMNRGEFQGERVTWATLSLKCTLGIHEDIHEAVRYRNMG